jgi:hypothetical protein
MANLREQELPLQLCIIAIMQKEELSDSRNRQAAGNDSPQNEDQIWQRGDLRRSLALIRNAPSGAPIAIRPPCLCQIPSHIIDDVTATFRAGAGGASGATPMAVSAPRSRRIYRPPPSSTSHLMTSSGQQASGMEMSLMAY